MDPPLVGPPPPATLIRRIFAHRGSRATVVRAPLLAVSSPRESDIPADLPTGKLALVAPIAVAAPPAPDDAAPATRADAAPPDAAHPPAPDSARGVGTRYCVTCDARVSVAADGLHCHRGHRLSPAHAARGRRPGRR